MWGYRILVLRLCLFLLSLAACALGEKRFPARKKSLKRRQRLLTHISLVVVSNVVLFGMSLLAALFSLQGIQSEFGLFNWVSLPFWCELVLGVLCLDLWVYLQHVFTHRVDFLWRFHQVHHADRDMDLLTGVRFHPVEMALSLMFKGVGILLLGLPLVVVLVFEVWLNTMALFTHANLKLPKTLDRILRCFIVTPSMHLVHHSVLGHECNSNYGFGFSLWDRLFRTYAASPSFVKLGLVQYQGDETAKFMWCLRLPFLSKQD